MTKFAVSGLTLIAFALRVHHLGRLSLWYDELLQLDIALGPFAEIWPQLHRHAAMPLDYLVLHVWLQLGRQEAWARYPALIFGTLSIPLIYVLGRHLISQKVGLISALLLTIASFSIRYSQEARPYALLLFFTMLTFWGVWRAYQTKCYRYWLIAFIGLLGAVLSHYFALFLLAPVGLFVGAKQLRQLKSLALWKQTAIFGLCTLIIVALFIFAGRFTVLKGVALRFAQDIGNPQTLTLPAEEKPNRGAGPPLTSAFIKANLIAPLSSDDNAILLLSALFCLAVFIKVKRYGWPIFLLFSWLIIPLALIYLFLLSRGTFFAIRYILYALPPFLILLAGGITFCTQWLINQLEKHSDGLSESRALQNSLIALCLIPFIFAEGGDLVEQYTAPAYEDWRAVGEILSAQALPQDAVIALRAEPALNWYYPPAQAPFSTYSTNEAIWQTLNQHPRRWFVLSSYSRKIDGGLRQWLSEQEAIAIEIDRRIIIYFHQEGLSKEEMLRQLQTGEETALKIAISQKQGSALRPESGQ